MTANPTEPRSGEPQGPTTHRLADGRSVPVAAYSDAYRYNVYDCPGPTGESERLDVQRMTVLEGEFGHGLLSMDVDEGVTPMFVTCPDDGRRATSRGYRSPSTIHRERGTFLPVRMIWRRATKGEIKRERRSALGEHYRLGGLEREWVR